MECDMAKKSQTPPDQNDDQTPDQNDDPVTTPDDNSEAPDPPVDYGSIVEDVKKLQSDMAELKETVAGLDSNTLTPQVKGSITTQINKAIAKLTGADVPPVTNPADVAPADASTDNDQSTSLESRTAAAEALATAGIKVQRVEDDGVDDNGNPVKKIVKAATPKPDDVLAATPTDTGWRVVLVDGTKHEVEA
jgi:hypothetical protein